MSEKADRTILIVEDSEAHRQILIKRLGSRYERIVEFDRAAAALAYLEANRVDLVISDFRMPEMDGLQLLESIRKIVDPQLPVIIATAFSSIDNAVEVFKSGASDYIPKPFQFPELYVSIDKLLERGDLFRENRELKRQLHLVKGTGKVIGNSPALQGILRKVVTISQSEAAVLITGPSGTGKDMIARELHQLSSRSDAKFVPVNCGALPDNLMESELFGHEKGAFTGATAQTIGLVEEAEGGTLFLDEVGCLPPNLQAKLLHLLQDKSYRAVGSVETRFASIRIIAATNEDLEKKVADGEFREDLYYRLAVVPVRMPPLVERKEDIPLLLSHFLVRYNDRDHKSLKGFGPRAMKGILEHDWPGNVRELENFVERSVALADPGCEWSDAVPGPEVPPDAGGERGASAGDPLSFAEEKKHVIEKFEREYLIRALTASRGNVTRAAEISGKNRSDLHALLKKYDIDAKLFKRRS